MSSPKIVSLHGVEIPQAGTPEPDVVDVLRKTLEMAESGEVKSILIVRIHSDGCTTSSFCGRINRRFVGEIEIAKTLIIEDLLQHEH